MKRIIFGFFLFCFLMLLMSGLFFSCVTPVKKVNKTFDKFPKESKQECVVRYPLKPSTIVEIRYEKGRVDTLYKHDTTRIDCDTIKPDTKGKKVFICPPCPPSTHQVDTMFIDTSHTIIDDRLVQLQNDTITSLRETNNQQKDKIATLKVQKANTTASLVTAICLLVVAITILIKKQFI